MEDYVRFLRARPEEVARLVYKLGNRQWNIPDLKRLLEDIVPESRQFDGYIVKHAFETIGLRTIGLNAREIRQAGKGTAMILLAIEDITHSSTTKL